MFSTEQPFVGPVTVTCGEKTRKNTRIKKMGKDFLTHQSCLQGLALGNSDDTMLVAPSTVSPARLGADCSRALPRDAPRVWRLPKAAVQRRAAGPAAAGGHGRPAA